MTPDMSTYALIAGMAAVTVFTRVSGYWIIQMVNPGPRIRRFLEATPPTVFAAMISPALVHGGPAEWLGALATIAAMKWNGNLAVAIFAGVGAVALTRLVSQ